VILFWTSLHAVEDFLCLYQSVAEPEDRTWGNGVCGAFDATPDSAGQSVLKTFEMAIRHNRAADTNGIRESFLSLDLYLLTFKDIFWPSRGGRSPPSPHMDPPLISVGWSALNIHRSLSAGDYVRYAMQMNSSFVILNSSFVLEA